MSRKRRSLSKKLRFEIFKRDEFSCQYCGATPPDVLLEVDHISPVKEGGGDEESNLVTACYDCNRGKAAIPLSVVPKSLPAKAAEIQEREAQLAGYREVIQGRADRIEDDMWQVAVVLDPPSEKDGMRRCFLQSIKTFNSKLDLHTVIDAAEIALVRFPYSLNPRFRYFCGICWKKIKRGEQ